MLVLVIAGGAFVLMFKNTLLPERYAFDSERIQRIASGRLWTIDPAFARPAGIYRAVGLEDNPTLAGFIGYGVAVLAILVVGLQSRHHAATTLTLVMMCACVLLSAMFLGFYSKDMFVFIPVFAVLLAPPGRRGLMLTVVALVVYALYFRPYWLAVGAIYLGLLFLMRRGWSLPRLVAAGLAAGVVAGLGLYFTAGRAPDYYRDLANAARENGINSTSQIREFVTLGEPLGGLANNLLTSLSLAVPLPLAALGGAYYLVLALGIFTLWAIFYRSAAIILRHRPVDARMSRALALVLAFSVTQGLFEPDYGTALRHLSPLLPLMLLVAWRASSERVSGDGVGDEIAELDAADVDPGAGRVVEPAPRVARLIR